MRLQVLIAICLTTLHFTGFQYLRDHLRHQGLEHLEYTEKDLHRGVISPIVYSFIFSCLPAWFFTSLQLYARLTECNKFKDANEPWTRKPLQMSDLEYCMTVLILKCYETCYNSCSLKLSLFFYAAKFSLADSSVNSSFSAWWPDRENFPPQWIQNSAASQLQYLFSLIMT